MWPVEVKWRARSTADVLGPRASCAKYGFVKYLRAFDLRFESPEDEAAYTKSRERPSLTYLTICATMVCMRQGALFVEQSAHKNAFVLSDGEIYKTRIGFAALTGSGILGCLVCVLLAALKLSRGCFDRLHHEVLWVLWTTLDLVSLCLEKNKDVMFLDDDDDPDGCSNKHSMQDGIGSSILLVLILVPFLIPLGAPMRLHVQVWFVLVVPFLYCVMEGLFQTVQPAIMPSVLITLCQFSATSALCSWRYEWFQRQDWWHRKELSHSVAMGAGMAAIAERLCDLVFRLDRDLRVCEDSDAHASFLGYRAKGMLFSQIVSESDRDRYHEMLQRATNSMVPQCMPVTVMHGKDPVEAELLAVDTGVQEIGYIVGMKIDIPLMGDAESVIAGVELTPGKDEREPRPTQGDDGMESLLTSERPETTATGQVFQEMRLEQIAHLGQSEHWCIGNDELELTSPARVLGSGSFGVVVAACLHGQLVAVKLPKVATTKVKGEAMRYLMNELRILRRLRHKNLVLFHGAAVDIRSGSIAVVYEFVNGKTLKHYVQQREGAASEPECYHIINDITSALRYLHAYRPPIVHADLKPGNVMVESGHSGPRAKLIDFGLSKLLSRSVTHIGGTLAWRAPELFSSGFILPGPAADIFSLGWLVYYITTGNSPHHGKQGQGLLESIHSMLVAGEVETLEWPPSSCFRAESQVLCAACLDLCPQSRPTAAGVHAMVSGWLTVDRACWFGFEVAQSVLPKSPWHAGVEELLEDGSKSRAAAPSSMEVLPSLEFTQIDIHLSASLLICGAWGRCDVERPECCGMSLCAWLLQPDALRAWLISVANDVLNGVVSAPLLVQSGRVGFQPVPCPDRQSNPRQASSAVLAALFPKAGPGMTRDDYVMSLRFTDWRPMSLPGRVACQVQSL